ncbi:hypothetical protein BH10PSE19_BH10PSE19_04420 [soil metagenome]
MLVTENQVAIYCTMRGTHEGNLFGLLPTGKKVKVNQMQIEHIENGKIVEHWCQSDDLAMLRQLGKIE